LEILQKEKPLYEFFVFYNAGQNYFLCLFLKKYYNGYIIFSMHKKHLSMTNTFLIICGVILVLAAVWTLGSWLVVRTIEQPKYTVIEKTQNYEIREYAPSIVAEVEVSGSRNESLNQGFRLLAGYIF